MDLDGWADQFFLRNAKLKGWRVTRDAEGYLVDAKKPQRYVVCEDLSAAPEADVVITLNSEENLRWAAERFDELPEQRIVFVNPIVDAFWTLNVRMIRTFGEPERFRSKPEAYSSEVAFV